MMRAGLSRFDCRFQHATSARCMHRYHVNAEFRGRANRPGHGIGYIVKLEIEENLAARVHQFGDESWTFGSKELKSDFVSRNGVAKLIDDLLSFNRRRHIQGHNQTFAHMHASILVRHKLRTKIRESHIWGAHVYFAPIRFIPDKLR